MIFCIIDFVGVGEKDEAGEHLSYIEVLQSARPYYEQRKRVSCSSRAIIYLLRMLSSFGVLQ